MNNIVFTLDDDVLDKHAKADFQCTSSQKQIVYSSTLTHYPNVQPNSLCSYPLVEKQQILIL